jgi:hypothetical protein
MWQLIKLLSLGIRASVVKEADNNILQERSISNLG